MPTALIHDDQQKDALQPTVGKALVVVIREAMFKGSIGTWAVQMDGREVTHLGTATHAIFEVAPGEHFLGGPMVQPQPIAVEANKIYYFNYDIPFTGGQAYAPLAEPRAQALISKSVRVKSY